MNLTLQASGRYCSYLYHAVYRPYIVYKLKPIESQPPRLYGLAKIHKNGVPIRPVLSMPGSPYFNIAKQMADWLSIVPECKINSSTKEIAEQLADTVLEDDKELVSFDVVSLYTNVPVNEAIVFCANLLYDGTLKKPPVDKDTFTKLILNNQSQLKFLNNLFSLLRFDK